MKVLPIILTCLALNCPINESKFGNLIDENKISTVKICSEGKLFQENIEIEVSSGEEKIFIEPSVNIGYNPQIFIANFLDNKLEQVFYSIEDNDNKNFYQIFSFNSGKAVCLFDSDNFKPTIEASYSDNNIIKISYQGKQLFLNNPSSDLCNHDDCLLNVSEVLTAIPYHNTRQDKYYLQLLQSVYGGYEANCFGYISSFIEIKEDGFTIISVGTSSNLII